ncbi:hypothetical protein HNY73_001707 [Argiope bruennichi]|uniref:Uncharacterized protein n=1 Tax=Argiope bruennichi TaxID=94029 RepID=A0A8T0FS69_ARGBR|nr:hypothetical protein HNY73_001707 [Argiope bruennichi]
MPNGRRLHPLLDSGHPDRLADPPFHHPYVYPTSQVLHPPHRSFHSVRHRLCLVPGSVRLPRQRRLALRWRKEETETQATLRNGTFEAFLGEWVLSWVSNSVRAGEGGVNPNHVTCIQECTDKYKGKQTVFICGNLRKIRTTGCMK